MKLCCICKKTIKQTNKTQYPLGTKFGFLCPDCISKGYFEKLQELKTLNDFEDFERCDIR